MKGKSASESSELTHRCSSCWTRFALDHREIVFLCFTLDIGLIFLKLTGFYINIKTKIVKFKANRILKCDLKINMIVTFIKTYIHYCL